MHLIRVGGTALNQTPLDWNGNRDRILAAIALAREQEIGILCLPELCLSGYGCDDMFQSPGVPRTAQDVLAEIVPATAGIIAAIGLPVRYESGVYDAVALLADGQIAGIVAKQHLAGEGIHYEPRWFRPWPRGHRATLVMAGRQVPLGDLRFDCGGVRIGFEICEDAWAPDRTGADLAARGVDLILNPSASHFAFGKDEIRRRFVQEGSRAFGVAYVYANLLGNESGRAIYDGGVLIASAGHMVAAGRRFSFADQAVASAVIDIDAMRLAQVRLSLEPRLESDPRGCVSVPFAPAAVDLAEAAGTKDARDAWEHGDHAKEEEFARAVSLVRLPPQKRLPRLRRVGQRWGRLVGCGLSRRDRHCVGNPRALRRRGRRPPRDRAPGGQRCRPIPRGPRAPSTRSCAMAAPSAGCRPPSAMLARGARACP